MLLEIFSYLNDHREFIQWGDPGGFHEQVMEREHVERSTAIRNFTMACRLLRDVLLPVLWNDVEGCTVIDYPRDGYTNGLYAQCEYLLSNPIVAAYVQCVSLSISPKMTHRARCPPAFSLWTYTLNMPQKT